MPVVSIPWGDKTASALTDSCVIITDAGVYSRPYTRGSRVTSVIFDAFIRLHNFVVRFVHGRYCIELSTRGGGVGITYIQMKREWDFNLLAFEFHSPADCMACPVRAYQAQDGVGNGFPPASG